MVFHNAENLDSFRRMQVEAVDFISKSKNSIKHFVLIKCLNGSYWRGDLKSIFVNNLSSTWG